MDELKKQILRWAKEQVEVSASPIDDHFVKIACRLLDVDYDDL